MSSDSPLRCELSELDPRVATVALLDHPCYGESGSPLGLAVTFFAETAADSVRSHYALSQSSCLAALSIDQSSYAVALTSSLVVSDLIVCLLGYLPGRSAPTSSLATFNRNILNLRNCNSHSERWWE